MHQTQDYTNRGADYTGGGGIHTSMSDMVCVDSMCSKTLIALLGLNKQAGKQASTPAPPNMSCVDKLLAGHVTPCHCLAGALATEPGIL